MAALVTWRRVPDEQHTGSVELRGAQGSPFLYVHPEDQADAATASPCARWAYNHNDTADDEQDADVFALTIRGTVSYRRYAQLWQAYHQLPVGQRPATFQEQDNAAAALEAPSLAGGAAALATGLQASGSATYDGFLSLEPEQDSVTVVTVCASARVRAFGTALLARIGQARSIVAEAHLSDGVQEVARVRATARIRFPFELRSAAATRTYVVTVPAGGSVRVALVRVGPAYEIRSGTSGFAGMSGVTITAV